MFNTILYLDEEKLNEYDSILKNRPSLKVNSRTIETKGKIGNTFIGAEGKVIDQANIQTNFNYDYFKFENMAKDNLSDEYYFDFTEKDYDISTIPSNAIIKLRVNANVPEEFDTSKMLDEYSNLLLDSMVGQPNYDMMKEMIDKRQVKIPILAESEDNKFFMKIDMDKLKVDYTEIESLEDDEIVIIGKKIRTKSQKVEIYNPYKDFLKIPRAFRRTIPKNKNTEFVFEPLIRDGLHYEIEVLAIYR